MSDITAILSLYRRPKYLIPQISAVRNQTMPPKEIWLWVNRSDEIEKADLGALPVDKIVVSTCNWGVFGRFSLAFMARTDNICVFDDDTIPGTKWIENCTEHVDAGMLGTAGIIIEHPDDHSKQTRCGWPSANTELTQVDLVGHSWFFKRKWLPTMWTEDPPVPTNSEDLHFSYMLQKYAGIDTFCPPHPREDTSMWGSLASYLGADGVGMSNQEGELKTRNDNERNIAIRHAIQGGWRTIRGHQRLQDPPTGPDRETKN